MIIETCEQGSDEWFALRLGNPGAAKFHEIVKTNGTRSATRGKYLCNLASELYTGKRVESYKNDRMDEGLEHENTSRRHYVFTNRVDILQAGLFWKDEQKKYHCSPDGYILDTKIGFETKDAIEHVQVARLLAKKPDPKHWTQCQGSLLVSGYNAWDYQSYCSVQEDLPVLTVRIYPDDKFLKKLETELDAFCLDLAAAVRELKKIGN